MSKAKEHPLLKVVRRELIHISTHWPYLFVTFVGPLLAFYLVMWIFSANVPRNLPVAVVDQDHTAMSRQLARMADATPIAAINRSFTSLQQAHLAMEQGKIDAILDIPAGTEKNILKGGSSNVALYLNNANVLKGGLINSGIKKALSTFSAGVKLQVKMKSGLTSTQAMQQIQPVMLRSEVLFNPFISYSYFLTSSLLPVMLIVFTLMGTTFAIGTEMQQGTGPQWLNEAGNHMSTALAGKILPYTIIYFCVAMVMNVILFSHLGVPLRGNLLILLTGELLMIVSYQFLAIFLIGLFGNLRLGLSLGGAYTMMALTFSGLTYPIFGMPAIAQAFAHIFPFTYWLKIFISQSMRGEPAANGLLPMLSFWFFIVFGALFIPRLKYMLLTKKYWGKI
jgi:ABC-2 type transport system permease protein